MVLRAPGRPGLAEGYCPGPVPNVVFVAPYLLEATVRFVEAAVRLPGARVALVGSEPGEAVPAALAAGLVTYVRVDDCLDAGQLAEGISEAGRRLGSVDRALSILEDLQVPLAQVREWLGISGMDAGEAANFRDKARMKDVLRAAGVPCARHGLAFSVDEAWAVAERCGFPVVVKPPAGAGARGTFRAESAEQFGQWLAVSPPSSGDPALIEEFMVGEEFSFDSVFIAGEMVWHSINHYMPSPLTVLEHPWIQWCVVLPRDISGPEFDPIRQAGADALRALGMHTGLSHMEWFRRADGSAAVSEVGARPPGAQFSTLMSFAYDVDMYAALGALDGVRHVRPSGAQVGSRRRVPPPAGSRPHQRRARHRPPRPGAAGPGGHGSSAATGADDLGELRGRRLRDRPASRDGSRRGCARAADHHPADRVGVADMDVLMISPGYPAEMPIFSAALAAEGANVIGVGDQPVSSLPDAARHALSRYVQISSFGDEERAVDEVLDALRGVNIDRVESMWEATMYLAARLRERIGAPGLDVAGTIPFRDKESMKEVLRAAGIRVPRCGASVDDRRRTRRRRGGRLPADHQADLGRRIDGHLSHRRARRARPGTARTPCGPRGERRGVRRWPGVHVRLDLHWRAVSPTTTCAGTGRAHSR